MKNALASKKITIEKEIEGIERNIKRTGKDINLPSFADHLKKYVSLISISVQEQNNEDLNIAIDYLPKLCYYCNDSNKEKINYIIEYIAITIHVIRFTNIFSQKEKREKFTSALVDLIQYLGNKLENEGIFFKEIKNFAYLLNEIVRVFLNFPELINDFIITTKNPFLLKEEQNFIIFSNLLLLLLYDQTIHEFEYIKYVRRSLIVYLSFDELSYSNYLLNSKFAEVLVIKLCNLYEILPDSFELSSNVETLEVSINMRRTFSIMTKQYFSMIDYTRFLCKICNCIVSHKIKEKFKYYFFNRFLLKMVQPKLLDNNPKVSRSNLQYLIGIIRYATNNEIIDVTANFLFGFNDEKFGKKFECEDEMSNLINKNKKINKNEEFENIEFQLNEDFDYQHHKSNKISYLLLNNLTKNFESINIITYELFEMFFEKRPYLMVKKFIKPYVEFCLKFIPDKSKYLYGTKNYPQTQSIENFLKIYEQFDKSNLVENIDSNMLKNYSYYMSYDIDFYMYYLKEKEAQENLNNQSVNENSISNSDDNFLVESLNRKIEIPKNENKEKKNQKNTNLINIDNNINEEIITLGNYLFEKSDEIEQLTKNMNFLLMKTIQEKLMNYQNNSQIENLFLVNLVLTIISVPILKFDPDLLECHAVLLDDDINSKFSILTVIKYIVQELNKEYNKDPNIKQNIILKLKEYQEQDKKRKEFTPLKQGNSEESSYQIIFSDKKKIENDNLKKAGNYIIFFEFLKEFMVSVMHKHKFEGLIENIFGFYSDLLDDYSNENASSQ